MECVVGGLTQHVGGNHNRLRCGEPSQTPTPTSELTSMKWRKLFTGPMQIFADAAEFRKTLYKYSVGNKFEYTYVKNSNSKMSVKCAVDGCQWKITANAMGKTTNYNVHIVDFEVHIVKYLRFDVNKENSFVNGCCVNCSHQCHVPEEVNTDARNVNPGNHNVNLEVPLLMRKFIS